MEACNHVAKNAANPTTVVTAAITSNAAFTGDAPELDVAFSACSGFSDLAMSLQIPVPCEVYLSLHRHSDRTQNEIAIYGFLQ
jgi:hypothetical protein